MRYRLLAVILVALLTAASASPRAGAQEAGEAVLTGFEQATVEGRFEAKLAFDGTPRSRILLLRNPDRVALDLYDTVSAAPLPKGTEGPVVAGMRQGLVSADRFRIVWTLKRTALPIAETRERGRADDPLAALRRIGCRGLRQGRGGPDRRDSRRGGVRDGERADAPEPSPSSSIPAMAASTPERRAPAARWRRRSTSPSRSRCATRSPRIRTCG